nr:MAG TPA: hypothetical protein [Caudoviricetes sp.]
MKANYSKPLGKNPLFTMYAISTPQHWHPCPPIVY